MLKICLSQPLHDFYHCFLCFHFFIYLIDLFSPTSHPMWEIKTYFFATFFAGMAFLTAFLGATFFTTFLTAFFGATFFMFVHHPFFFVSCYYLKIVSILDVGSYDM